MTNMIIDNADDIVSELKLYRLAGGGTVCDLTPNSMRYHFIYNNYCTTICQNI